MCVNMPNKSLITGWIFSALLTISAQTPAHASQAWPFWLPHTTATQTIDHSNWQLFLDQYVTLHNDGITRVNYAGAAGEGHALLRNYLRQVTQIDPRGLNRNEQMAYWINLYNALTVDIVLQHPQKKSIKRMGARLFSFGPWDDPVIKIAGQTLTLNDIEHRILRPIWQDHRIHYAVNCASVSCPNLSAIAFSGALLEPALSAAERTYINHPRGVSVDNPDSLTLSSIFNWYQSDFASDQAGLLNYLARHHETLNESLQNFSGTVDFNYDWTLNSTQHER